MVAQLTESFSDPIEETEEVAMLELSFLAVARERIIVISSGGRFETQIW